MRNSYNSSRFNQRSLRATVIDQEMIYHLSVLQGLIHSTSRQNVSPPLGLVKAVDSSIHCASFVAQCKSGILAIQNYCITQITL